MKRYLKDWSTIKELALDMREWKLAIHVSKAQNLDLMFFLFYCLFMLVFLFLFIRHFSPFFVFQIFYCLFPFFPI
jgi:hypothetical protein